MAVFCLNCQGMNGGGGGGGGAYDDYMEEEGGNGGSGTAVDTEDASSRLIDIINTPSGPVSICQDPLDVSRLKTV